MSDTGSIPQGIQNASGSVRVFSDGSGVQSVAALVLAARREIDFSIFAFCNVGSDSENPLTLAYYRDYSLPFALAHNIRSVELRRRRRSDGVELTVLGELQRANKSIGIPVRMKNGAPGRRSCTFDFKVQQVANFVRSLGARKRSPAVVGVGISLDELERMRSGSGFSYLVNSYPLVDLRLTRQDCLNIIADAGLPPPPKSSCYFCPFHRMSEWQRMADQQPILFRQAVEIELQINVKRASFGMGAVFLTDKGLPLDVAVGTYSQLSFFETAARDEITYSCAPFACTGGV